MYLSKLVLNPRSSEARRDMDSPYEMHRTLKRIFPDGELEANRILFRVESARGTPAVMALVQSVIAEPDLEQLPRGYCAMPPSTKHIDPALSIGQLLAFRLHANPTVKRDGRRLGLVREEEHQKWLRRKGEQGGFRILYAHAAPFKLGGRWYGKTDEENKVAIPHFGVRFDGILRVADPDLLVAALRNGVGSAKAFGFGLLTLAPPG